MIGPVPAKNAFTCLSPNPRDLRPLPDGVAEGSEYGFVRQALLAQRPAEVHVGRDKIVEVHSRPSSVKSPTMRSAARSTLA